MNEGDDHLPSTLATPEWIKDWSLSSLKADQDRRHSGQPWPQHCLPWLRIPRQMSQEICGLQRAAIEAYQDYRRNRFRQVPSRRNVFRLDRKPSQLSRSEAHRRGIKAPRRSNGAHLHRPWRAALCRCWIEGFLAPAEKAEGARERAEAAARDPR
jgi:hypothetical protein